MLKVQAAGDLLIRYLQIFRAAWSVRRDFNPLKRVGQELEFLPASLELVETPVHPAPRYAMISVAALGIIAVVGAIFGRLDIVATAKGKLVPNERVKLIQPAVTGVVRSIHVVDGQRISAGDLLMELDPTQAAADSRKAHSSRLAAAEAAARAYALLEAQRHGGQPIVAAIPGTATTEQLESQRFADGLMSEYHDKLANARAQLAKVEAESQSTRHEIEKLRATAPLARQQANDYQSLVERKYVAKTDYLDKEQNALQQEHELDAQESHARELAAAVSAQRSSFAGIASQFRREQLDALDKARQQLAQNQDDETKARTREGLMTLKSPVAGTVQQLAVHTLGGVVTIAQTLMEIVPEDAMEVEASIENKDIGFVHAGQEAVIKIEAFPYTRYGFLIGTIRSVSNDAVQDKKGVLTFAAHIRLPTNRMRIDKEWISLTPGMTTTVEIKTGERNVARYFIDPLVQSSQESLRER